MGMPEQHGRHRPARQSSCRVRDAPIDRRRSSFAFLSEKGSIEFLTTKDQIDVGISGPLQTGFGFFDPLHHADEEHRVEDIRPDRACFDWPATG